MLNSRISERYGYPAVLPHERMTAMSARADVIVNFPSVHHVRNREANDDGSKAAMSAILVCPVSGPWGENLPFVLPPGHVSNDKAANDVGRRQCQPGSRLAIFALIHCRRLLLSSSRDGQLPDPD